MEQLLAKQFTNSMRSLFSSYQFNWQPEAHWVQKVKVQCMPISNNCCHTQKTYIIIILDNGKHFKPPKGNYLNIHYQAGENNWFSVLSNTPKVFACTQSIAVQKLSSPRLLPPTSAVEVIESLPCFRLYVYLSCQKDYGTREGYGTREVRQHSGFVILLCFLHLCIQLGKDFVTA